MSYKVIVAHPGKQHSFYLASSLKEEDILFKYITTVYDKDKSILMNTLKKFLKKDNLTRASSRKNPDLDDNDVIQYNQLSGLVEIILSRQKNNRLYNWWRQKNADSFGKKVAKYAIKNNVDAVICYDTNSNTTFDILKKQAPHIKRILDVSAANRMYMKKVYEKDIATIPEEFSNKLKEESFYLWQETSIQLLEKEIEQTQYFISPSKFVKDTLIYSGVSEESIGICPYGASFGDKSYSRDKRNGNQAIRAIYVGNVTEMKGIYYLLEAVMKIPKELLELTIVGAYDNSDGIFNSYMDRVKFTGRLLHSEVEKMLYESDIFVFPSLGDGFSLAVLEALSCGLPSIVTCNTGAADAIIEGENGFVVPIQDSEVLYNKLMYFVNHKEVISRMSQLAQETSKEYSWEKYKNIIINQLTTWLSK